MFYNPCERIASDLHSVDYGLGFVVICHCDRKVNVLSEARLCSERDREPPDERPPDPDGIQVRSCLAENYLNRFHGSLTA